MLLCGYFYIFKGAWSDFVQVFFKPFENVPFGDFNGNTKSMVNIQCTDSNKITIYSENHIFEKFPQDKLNIILFVIKRLQLLN